MPKFRNGLAKVGRVYHYKFSLRGRAHHGSTHCETLEAAKAWLKRYRDNQPLQNSGATTGRFAQWSSSSTLHAHTPHSERTGGQPPIATSLTK